MKAPVFLSRGGDTYHSRASCPAFIAGRRKAVRFGCENHPVEMVRIDQAALMDFVPCQACYGVAAFATRAG